MHKLFPKVNIVAILCCAVVMYTAMVRYDMKITGFIMGSMTRFAVECVWELVHLYRNFPSQIRALPSLADVLSDLGAIMRFSFIFAVGYSSEIMIFEVVPFILFQSAHPTRNIALWMSLYQIGGISRLTG